MKNRPVGTANERIRDGPPPLPPRPGSSQVVPASPRGLCFVSCGFLWPSCPFLLSAARNGNETERNSGTLAATERKRKRHKATQGRNGNETDTEGSRERKGECADLSPFPLYRDRPFSLPFPVPVRATIKTIFPPLRYVSPHFEKKVKKYL